ncbi:DUF3592 domain-containing protein [Streptomyces fuscigenes]|uniref:DUF3592 domain-containing protein n=1 Tax=Streptomyces fuscigenes TaxID=1528880 RepID=UPI001F34F446|nr:DUF3592 domain-containing protein [Streptomyces fuscigenes]
MAIFAVAWAALAVLVAIPEAHHLRSFRDGVRADAVLYKSGSCVVGRCQVEFKVSGRAVAADLPAGTNAKGSQEGTAMTVRYHPDHPHEAVIESQVGGSGPIATAVLSAGAALFCLVYAVWTLVAGLRKRRMALG